MTILFPKYHFYPEVSGQAILHFIFYILHFIARNRNGKKVTHLCANSFPHILCGGKDLVDTAKNQIQRIRKFL
jgi:hypothetical protein